MSASLWGRQFREQMLASNYPFDDRATLTTSDGLAIAADLFIDARLHPVGSFTKLSLTGVTTALSGATCWIGDVDQPRAASATIDPASPPSQVAVIDSLGRPAGLLLVNPTAAAALQGWPAGDHPLPDGAADFVAAVAVPSVGSGVRALVAGGTALTDTVRLLGRQGVVLTADPATGTITAHAVGDPLFKRRACLDAGATFTTPTYLMSINGIGPDAQGNFLLAAATIARANPALRIDPEGTDTIVISVAGGG